MAKVKNAITKPKFSNIFAARFVVFFVIFMLIGGITVELMGEYINSITVSEGLNAGKIASIQSALSC